MTHFPIVRTALLAAGIALAGTAAHAETTLRNCSGYDLTLGTSSGPAGAWDPGSSAQQDALNAAAQSAKVLKNGKSRTLHPHPAKKLYIAITRTDLSVKYHYRKSPNGHYLITRTEPRTDEDKIYHVKPAPFNSCPPQ